MLFGPWITWLFLEPATGLNHSPESYSRDLEQGPLVSRTASFQLTDAASRFAAIPDVLVGLALIDPDCRVAVEEVGLVVLDAGPCRRISGWRWSLAGLGWTRHKEINYQDGKQGLRTHDKAVQCFTQFFDCVFPHLSKMQYLP